MSRPVAASVPKLGFARSASRRRSLVCVLFGVAFGLLTAQAAHAHAQAAPDASAQEARDLFNEGLEFADQNRWAEAAERFRHALALRPSPVIEYNLGTALRQLHRWVEACASFTSASTDRAASPALHRAAARALAELKPRLGRLTVDVEGLHDGDQVSLDDRALDAPARAAAITVDPGSHQLRVTRGEQTLHREPVLVFEGALRAVVVQLPPTPIDTARLASNEQKSPPASIPLPPPSPAAKESTETPLWVWAGASALVVSAITMTVVLLANGNGSKSPAAGDFDPPVVHLRPKTP